uniref:Uncharacterized protein n=1 Tax=Anguilla anguilla TaxID=7936 RepID=A0A0E9WUA8_ANGAN
MVHSKLHRHICTKMSSIDFSSSSHRCIIYPVDTIFQYGPISSHDVSRHTCGLLVLLCLIFTIFV